MLALPHTFFIWLAWAVIAPALASTAQPPQADGPAVSNVVPVKVETLVDDIDAGAGGLAIDEKGNLYTADFGWRLSGGGKGGDKVFKVSPDGKVDLFCKGMRGASGNTIAADGSLYQSSISGGFISRVSPGGKVTVVAKTGLNAPVGIAQGDDGSLFICNCGSNLIQQVDSTGKATTFARSQLFKCPNGITRGPDGTLYVCNFGNGDVPKVSPNGKVSLLATLPGSNNGHLTFHQGVLYVVARTDCRVYRVGLDGTVTQFAGSGGRGKADGAPDQCSLSLPNSIVVSPDGKYMYVNETSPVSGDPKILGPTRIRRIEVRPAEPGEVANFKTVQQPSQLLLAGMRDAGMLLARQDFVEAENVLRPLAEEFADNPSPVFLLGYALQANKKYDQARLVYEKVFKFPQVKARALYNLACMDSIERKHDQAFVRLDEAVEAGFNNPFQLQNDPDLANIRNDPRFRRLVASLQATDLPKSEIFVEPARVIGNWNGEAAGDQFGWTARRTGDLDGDGAIDFVATAPTHNKGAGKIYVYSSKSQKLLFEVAGKPGYRLGNSAVGIGDVNGDSVPDVIAGAPFANRKGAAFVYSGKDGSQLLKVNGKTMGGQFGYEVSEAGDLDGDSVPDFLVGEKDGDGQSKKSGKLYAFSGKTAKQIFAIDGQEAGDCFGNAAAVASTKEGNFLLAVGAQNAGTGNRGRVYVYDVKAAKPTLKFVIESDKHGANLGQMFISFPGDIDQDGVPDVYASDFSDKTKARGGGKVVVHSGADGRELIAIYGSVAGEGLGTSPSDAGDVDGDGIGDLAIGAWQNNKGAKSGGRIYLYSLAGKGKLLKTWTSKVAGDTLGFDACGIGDVDGDGKIDFLVTSAWSNVGGPKTGRVFILAGE